MPTTTTYAAARRARSSDVYRTAALPTSTPKGPPLGKSRVKTGPWPDRLGDDQASRATTPNTNRGAPKVTIVDCLRAAKELYGTVSPTPTQVHEAMECLLWMRHHWYDAPSVTAANERRRQRASKDLRAEATAARSRRPVCPSCHLHLPAAKATCDNCDEDLTLTCSVTTTNATDKVLEDA